MRARLALVALLALLGLTAAAPTGDRVATSLPDVEDEVMCTTCGVPLNIAESPQADRQRAFIRTQVDRGLTKDEVKAVLVAEYGPDVLAMPQDEGIGRAAYLVPIAESAATRMCCSTPSFRMASGSPFRADSRNTSPQNVPGSTQCFSWVRVPAYSTSVSTSDFMRMAK